MTDRVFIRQLTDDRWEWRVVNADGSWKQDIHTASPDELIADLKELSLPVSALLDGRFAISRNVPLDGTEKKLIAKVLPYELEEELIDAVEDLHFCFGHVADDRVNLVYLGVDAIESALAVLEPSGCEVPDILPDYLALDPGDFSGILLMDEGGYVVANFSDGVGFSAELNVAQFVLAQMSTEENPRDLSALLLVAPSVDAIAELKTCIPESWFDSELQLEEQLGDFWEYASAAGIDSGMNLRSGTFARQLPFERWWHMWKIPAYAMAAAFVISLCINFFDYLTAKSEGKNIRTQIQQVYLQAVPNGRTGDEERRLRALLKDSGKANSSEPTNLSVILAGFSKSMQQQKDVTLNNFRYSGDQRELQINIEVKGLGELGQFRELMSTNGLETDSPRTNRLDDRYQANMKVLEKK